MEIFIISIFRIFFIYTKSAVADIYIYIYIYIPECSHQRTPSGCSHTKEHPLGVHTPKNTVRVFADQTLAGQRASCGFSATARRWRWSSPTLHTPCGASRTCGYTYIYIHIHVYIYIFIILVIASFENMSVSKKINYLLRKYSIFSPPRFGGVRCPTFFPEGRLPVFC